MVNACEGLVGRYHICQCTRACLYQRTYNPSSDRKANDVQSAKQGWVSGCHY